jgi:hypothetical protein
MTAATKAIVILVDMTIFSSCPKQIGIANWIRARRRLFLRFALSGVMGDGRLSAGHHPMLQRLSHPK